MLRNSPPADLFKQRLSDSLKVGTKNFRTVEIAKNENVYTCGDKSESIYFIERGQIKLLMLSPAGKECLLAIRSAGDVFGELGLTHLGERRETATAMTETVLKKIPPSEFLLLLRADSLLEGFVGYLAVKISEQQDMISDLVTIDSEQRLGKTLLRLAEKEGGSNSRSIRFTYKITHEELSEIVGTTRPRISKFMQRFRKLGLIGISTDRFIIVKEKNLTDYLDQFN